MIKIFIVTFTALVLACASQAATATVGNLILKVSGTAQFQGTSSDKGNLHITTTVTKPFTQADVYSLIVNAVSNAAVNFSTVPTQALPANGYIAYNPGYETNMYANTIYDTTYTNITGLFYVTNSSGFYYPLSGRDTNGNYYSFLELNTRDSVLGGQGFSYPFNAISSSSKNKDTGDGSITDTETASLYIHNNPFISDEADLPGLFYFNTEHAIEIRGVLKISFKVKGSKVTTSGTLTGTGNIRLDNQTGQGVITTGKVTFTAAP